MIFRKISFGIIWFLVLSSFAAAQNAFVHPRIAESINETRVISLAGNTHPLARSESDRGISSRSLQLDRILLVLQRSPQQESALKTLLDQQQDNSSPNYHSWLTPDQFGQQFGPTDQDIQTITSWLSSHGFQVTRVARSKGVIEFSGTAGQVQAAFHTEIHKYHVNGNDYWANASDPMIPSALVPVIAGVTSLNNFGRKPQHVVWNSSPGNANDNVLSSRNNPMSGNPLFTRSALCGLDGSPCYDVSPYDLATIYNILPLWNASTPIDGTGQTIAIVAQSGIFPQDVIDFHDDFGLPPPNVNLIIVGPDPGLIAQTDEMESDLDVEWASSIAKGATIDLVSSASTTATAGVDLSAEYIVDNNLAPILSESYGTCELDMGTAGNLFYKQLWQQAAAEGISVFVSSGDSGSAGCDRNSPIADQGLAVNGIASTPYNVAVGGTDFNDLQNPSAYWNPITGNDPTTQVSAKSYIPEMAWNNTCTNGEFFSFTGKTDAESDCNDSTSVFWPNFLVPIGAGGGASNCIASSGQSLASCSGGYPKPLWQAGPGVPNDGKRDMPDVSLFAAGGLNAHWYVICETDIFGGCGSNPFNTIPIGGTSASTPVMAAIMAMVNQKMGGRQGNPNYVLYSLAAQPGVSCDSSGTLGSSCIFYDVTNGTIATPCVTGSPNCGTNVAGDQNGVLSGYAATPGYDLATGLGSVNVANLVNSWGTVSFRPTISSLSLSPTTQITHGSAVNFDVSVAPKSGSGQPSGSVSLFTSGGPVAGTFTLTNGTASGTTALLPGGSYSVTAHYAGDGTFAASDSVPGIPVTVGPEPSNTTVQAFTLDQNNNPVPYTTAPYGANIIYLRADVAGQSRQGIATGNVTFSESVNGGPTTFGSNLYPLNSEGYTLTPLPGHSSYRAFPVGTYSFTGNYSGDPSLNRFSP